MSARAISIGAILKLALIASMTWTAACEEESRPNAPQAVKNQQKQCSDKGGTYLIEQSKCVCPEGQTWDEGRCTVATDRSQSLAKIPAEGPANCAASGGQWDQAGQRCICYQGDGKEEIPCPTVELSGAGADAADSPRGGPAAQGEDMCAGAGSGKEKACGGTEWAKVQKACETAGGRWVANQSYCSCSGRKVLFGQRCRYLLVRHLNRKLCENNVLPGRWFQGSCRCSGGQIFSPARGGCVQKPAAPHPTALQEIAAANAPPDESGTMKDVWSKNILAREPFAKVTITAAAGMPFKRYATAHSAGFGSIKLAVRFWSLPSTTPAEAKPTAGAGTLRRKLAHVQEPTSGMLVLSSVLLPIKDLRPCYAFIAMEFPAL